MMGNLIDHLCTLLGINFQAYMYYSKSQPRSSISVVSIISCQMVISAVVIISCQMATLNS